MLVAAAVATPIAGWSAAPAFLDPVALGAGIGVGIAGVALVIAGVAVHHETPG